MSAKRITIAPITPAYEDHGGLFDQPFEMDGGVFLGRAPEWLKDEQITNGMRADEKEDAREASLALWTEKDLTPGLEQPAPFAALLFANFALWLAEPTGIGFSFIVDTTWYGSQMRYFSFHNLRGIFPHVNYMHDEIAEAELQVAREIHGRLIDVEFRKTQGLWTAVRTCWLAMIQRDEDWDVRYLFQWVALEALFGPENPGETVHQISERLALFLAEQGVRGAKELYRTAKRCYAWRSKLIHGRSMEKLTDAESTEISYETDTLIRLSLRHILAGEDRIATFASEKRRNQYFQELMLGPRIPQVPALPTDEKD